MWVRQVSSTRPGRSGSITGIRCSASAQSGRVAAMLVSPAPPCTPRIQSCGRASVRSADGRTGSGVGIRPPCCGREGPFVIGWQAQSADSADGAVRPSSHGLIMLTDSVPESVLLRSVLLDPALVDLAVFAT